MLRSLLGVASVAVAVLWGAVWLAGGAWAVAIAWFGAWAVVLGTDYQLYRETAPPVPVVTPEVVDNADSD